MSTYMEALKRVGSKKIGSSKDDFKAPSQTTGERPINTGSIQTGKKNC